jgi:hypothetical protein
MDLASYRFMIDQNNDDDDDDDGMENVLTASLLAWPTLPLCCPSHNDRLSSVVVIASVSTTSHIKWLSPALVHAIARPETIKIHTRALGKR